LHHADELPGDFSFTRQHGKHAMAEQGLQVFELESMGDLEHPLTVKGAVSCHYMQMGMIPIWPLTKSLCGHDYPWGGLWFWHRGL
jgi:hypothetical protein